jgi:hypothetical protein
MAERVEIDIPGIGVIEAKNAASEATLQEILKVLQGIETNTDQANKNTKKGSSGSAGSSAAAGAGASLTAAGAAANAFATLLKMASAATGGLIKGLNVATKTTGTALGLAAAGAGFAAGQLMAAGNAALRVVDTFVGLGHSAINLAQSLANMGDSVSGAASVTANALSRLPGVFGAIGSLIGAAFTAAAGAAEKMVGAYQSAASVGATFGGSLNNLVAAASGAGMEMGKFAALIAQNANAMVYLGGTTESGARRFADLSKTMRSSGVNTELLRMGFSTEQINNGMAEYIGIIGKTGALQNMTTQQIAKSSGAYLKDLDLLRRLTGESAAQQKAANDKLMADAQFRAAMLGKDAETQKAMMAYINSLPEELRDGAKEMLATGQVTSDAGVKFAAALPGAANEAMAFGRNLKAGGKLSMDESLRARQNLISEAKVRQNTLKDQALYNTELQSTMLGVMNAAAASSKGYGEMTREQAEAAKKANQAEQIEKFKARIAEVSNSFTAMLASSGILDALMKTFEVVVGVISSLVVPAFTAIFGAVNAILPPIMNMVVPAITGFAAAITTMLQPVIGTIVGMFQELDEKLGGTASILQNFYDRIFPVFSAVVRGGIIVFEGVFDAVMSLIDPIKNLFSSFSNYSNALAQLTGGTDGLVDTILTAGVMISGYFSALGEILGMVINGAAGLVRWFSEVAMKAEFVRNMLGFVGQGFEFLKTYLSAAGIKAMFAGLDKIVGDIGDFVGGFIDGFKGMLAELLIMAGKILPGLSDKGKEMKKEVEESTKEREKAAKERAVNFEKAKTAAKEDSKQRFARVEEEKKAVKQDQQTFAERQRHLSSMGGLNKEEEDKKKAELGGGVDMSSPLAMLESFSRQQGGFFAERIDQGRKEQEIAREKKAIEAEASKVYEQAAKAKTDEEKKAASAAIDALKERMKKFEEMVSGVKPTAAPGTAPAPGTGAPTKLPAGSQIQGLGAVAAHFEAGGKAGTVSTGHGDFGGKSYGAFQLSSKTGDVQKFLEKSGYAKQFEGLAVGSKAFDAKWKELGETKEFAQAQATHAKSTHYDPQMAKLSKSGLDMSGRGAGVQEAIMSTANQYGANTDVIIKALKDKDTSKMSDKDIINAIQDYKAQTVQTRFKSSSEAVRAGVAKRIEQERSMLLGVDGGAVQADARKGEQQKAKPPESKPGKESSTRIDPKLANDWAYSVFMGKNSMSQVPKPYLDEVGKILAKPPANWVSAPKTPEAKIETAQTEQGKPPQQKPVEEVKSKLGGKAVQNWAYAVFEGKITLGQVPQMYRDQVAEVLKNPPADWVKSPGEAKPAKPVGAESESAQATATTPTNEEFKINGKQVSKEEFDAYMKANPQAAQMMDMAKQMSGGSPSVDLMKNMGGILPVGSNISAESILGKETFASTFDPLRDSSLDAIAPMAESKLGSTDALTGAEGFKQTMSEDAAAKMAQEQQARKAMFDMMGRTDVEGAVMRRAGQAGSAGGGEKAKDPVELLNSKLEQLIMINQNIANLNSDQLRVQKNFNTGDVYNSAG